MFNWLYINQIFFATGFPGLLWYLLRTAAVAAVCVVCLVSKSRVGRKHRKRLSLGASKVDSAVNKNAFNNTVFLYGKQKLTISRVIEHMWSKIPSPLEKTMRRSLDDFCVSFVKDFIRHCQLIILGKVRKSSLIVCLLSFLVALLTVTSAPAQLHLVPWLCSEAMVDRKVSWNRKRRLLNSTWWARVSSCTVQ